MKKTLFLFALFPLYAKAQTISKALNPTGFSMSYAPGITLNNSTSATTVYLDSIPAGTFTPGRKYEFNIYGSITTPATLAPTLTLTVSLGSSSVTLISGAVLGISQTKKPFRVHVTTSSYSLSSQFIYIEVLSDNTGIVFGSTYLAKSQALSEDLNTTKAMKVTAQFSSAVNLATTWFYIDNVYKENF